MKIYDKRCGWSVEGAYIEVLPAGLDVTEDQMRAYFGAAPGDRHYEEHVKAAAFARVVVQKPAGEFVIVPINPDCYVTDAGENP